MAEILGLGLTHYPLLSVTDEHMADLLRWTLRDPDIPAAEKDPADWPVLMRSEWADDYDANFAQARETAEVIHTADSKLYREAASRLGDALGIRLLHLLRQRVNL